ncbi:hypothetical protein VL15_34345 [Burkholderia cepacia]|uniref:Uncharacterized protein n=1 Tax=Burkholderia cepacia TaxID=292 RepID=A0A0J5W7S7_BURCE|nr:hypothetical protein VL15_34345 [Burkholderia cepacia]
MERSSRICLKEVKQYRNDRVVATASDLVYFVEYQNRSCRISFGKDFEYCPGPSLAPSTVPAHELEARLCASSGPLSHWHRERLGELGREMRFTNAGFAHEQNGANAKLFATHGTCKHEIDHQFSNGLTQVCEAFACNIKSLQCLLNIGKLSTAFVAAGLLKQRSCVLLLTRVGAVQSSVCLLKCIWREYMDMPCPGST